MAELVLHDVETDLLEKLRNRAIRHGLTEEEEHRQILADALSNERSDPPDVGRSLWEVLTRNAPTLTEEEHASVFERKRDVPRKLDFE